LWRVASQRLRAAFGDEKTLGDFKAPSSGRHAESNLIAFNPEDLISD
jgi:hypothetical protein